MPKYAVIMTTGRSKAALQAVDQGHSFFKQEGYITYVASAVPPTMAPDQYSLATSDLMTKLVYQLKIHIKSGDDLVIYAPTFDATQDLSLARLLDDIPFARRTVITAPRSSSLWNRMFLDNPKSLVMEIDNAARFWSPASTIPDLNHDGSVNWQERFTHAAAANRASALRVFPSPGYAHDGTPPFSEQVQMVKDDTELQLALKRLQPGQFAFLYFSASWCESCASYSPHYIKMAQENRGQHLWLRTENEDLLKTWGINQVPAVVVVDAQGSRFPLEGIGLVTTALAELAISPVDRLQVYLERVEAMEISDRRVYGLLHVMTRLMKLGERARAIDVYNKAIDTAFKLSDPNDVTLLLGSIAEDMANAGYAAADAKDLMRIFNEIRRIPDPFYRAQHWTRVSLELIKTPQKDLGIRMFHKMVAEAEALPKGMARIKTHAGIASALSDIGMDLGTSMDEVAMGMYRKLSFHTEWQRPHSVAEVVAQSRVGLPRDLLTSINTTAKYFFNTGPRTKTAEFLDHMVVAAEPLPVFKRALVFSNIAGWMVAAGVSDDKFNALFLRASQLAAECPDAARRARAYVFIAHTMWNSKLPHSARLQLENAITEAGRSPYSVNRGTAIAYINGVMGVMALGEKDWPLFERVVTLAEEIEDPFQRARSLIGVAVNLVASGQTPQAQDTFNRAATAISQIEPADRKQLMSNVLAREAQKAGLSGN